MYLYPFSKMKSEKITNMTSHKYLLVCKCTKFFPSLLQYDTTFGKGRNDATKKQEDDKSTTSRITKYGGGSYSGSGYQRDASTGKHNFFQLPVSHFTVIGC